jgi:hypothetical protein
MSSENRFIAWKTFESDVPPLKRSRPARVSIEKSCFSTQQTQKSFSIMASGRPLRSAVSANTSARLSAGIWAIPFKQPSPRSVSPLRRSNPRRNACLSRACVFPPVITRLSASKSHATQRPPCQGGAAPEPSLCRLRWHSALFLEQ